MLCMTRARPEYSAVGARLLAARRFSDRTWARRGGRACRERRDPMANSVGLHEAQELLRAETMDRHRALASMQEELEAVDWYDQRVDAASDPELKQILAHNRDEEKEHFVMTLEWLRRRDPKLSGELQSRLF